MKRALNYCGLLFLLSASIYFTGCTKDYYEVTTINLNDTISFSAAIKPIFSAECTQSGCHNTGGIAPDLTPDNAYSNLILYNLVDTENPESSELYTRMNSTSNPMPPTGKLNDLQIQQVLAWIKQGANDN